LDGLGAPRLRFSNLDVKSIFHNYLKNYELKTLNTYVNTYKSRQNSKIGKEPRKKCKVRKVKKKRKKPVSTSYGRASSSCSSDFLEDSVKEHTAH